MWRQQTHHRHRHRHRHCSIVIVLLLIIIVNPVMVISPVFFSAFHHYLHFISVFIDTYRENKISCLLHTNRYHLFGKRHWTTVMQPVNANGTLLCNFLNSHEFRRQATITQSMTFCELYSLNHLYQLSSKTFHCIIIECDVNNMRGSSINNEFNLLPWISFISPFINMDKLWSRRG